MAKKSSTNWWQKLNSWANVHEWLLLLITFAIILRLPTLFEPMWYGDENIYLAIGQSMRAGQVLYRDVTDYPNKPPMIYWLAALAQNVQNFRFILLLWSIPGVIFFYKLAQLLYRSTPLSFFATLTYIYLTSTPLWEGTIANAEIFFIVPSIIGIYLLYSQKGHLTNPAKILIAGTCLGISLLFKVHVLLDLALVGLFFFIFPVKLRINQLLKLVCSWQPWLFLLGVVSPILLSLGWLAIQGVRPSALIQNAASSSTYTAVWGDAEWLRQTLGMGSLMSRSIALGVLIGFLYIVRFRLDKRVLFVVLWLGLSLYASLLSARPYPHYLIQIIPPLVLAIFLLPAKLKLSQISLVIVSLSLVVAAYWRFDFFFWPVKSYYKNFIAYLSQQIDTNEYYRRFDRRMPRNYSVAEVIRQNTGAKDSIYVWGTESDIYLLSGRVQSGPLVVSFHVEDLDYYDETLALLQANPPQIIVLMETESRPFPGLVNFVDSHYLWLDTIGDPDLSKQENQGFQAKIYRRADFF